MMIGGITTLLATEATSAVRQQVKGLAFIIAGIVVALGAGATGMVALHQWLSATMPALHATLWIAGGLSILAIILLLVGISIRSAKRKRSALNMTAVALMPTAARLAFRKTNFATLGVGGILALGAILGRKLGR